MWGASSQEIFWFTKPTLEWVREGLRGGALPTPSLARRKAICYKQRTTPGPPEEIRYVLGRTNHAQ